MDHLIIRQLFNIWIPDESGIQIPTVTQTVTKQYRESKQELILLIVSGIQRPDGGAAAAGVGARSSPVGRQDAMSKISSLIPPPPTHATTPTKTSLSDGSDDDWS